jgi:energy-coupling factor transporter ATP-binding protein EcfA2
MLRLKRYHVWNFRSVDDSGPIEVDDVTALIGTNESGKTNLLLPLWKLKPAKDGAIIPMADFPRKKFNDYRNLKQKPNFVEGIFDVPADIRQKLATMTGFPAEMFAEVKFWKNLDGGLFVSFIGVTIDRELPSQEVIGVLENARKELDVATPLKGEVELKPKMMAAIDAALNLAKANNAVSEDGFVAIRKSLEVPDSAGTPKSSIGPRFVRLGEEITDLVGTISKPHPNKSEEARNFIAKYLPSFVYYSNYGNLDSEIYLPHVIENMKREDLGSKEAAKARTLKVLFEFVGLQPDEILELGRDLKEPAPGKELTEEEIQIVSDRKKERSILLQSAGTKLTTEFRNWWEQGAYRFRFEADGDHFRIWVSDDLRPEEVELEGRSTGLQWFLSFYLVFLVESKDSHEGSILLLDEPGLSLHPLAQQDLTHFFDGLARTNQILYTTHSPFLIDADQLNRARKVYVADDGTSKLSADLQFQGTEKTRRAAGYTVWSALGIAVAESFLYGCQPVIVEGPSDQHYLTAIKLHLIKLGKLKPSREMVFPPAGGAKGVKAVTAIIVAKDDKLPQVLFDGDAMGLQAIQQLKDSLYANDKEKLLCVTDFVNIPVAEIEDLMPSDMIVKGVDVVFRAADKPFGDIYKAGTAIVPQVESWAARNSVTLELGWKVEVAKRVKHRILDGAAIDDNTLGVWEKVFKKFTE